MNITRGRQLPFGLAVAVMIITLVIGGAAQAGPVMRIPKMKTPPAIDGVITPEEWHGASAVAGLEDYYVHDLYPESMRSVWYLGYDDRNLYLAMYKRIPAEIQFKADAKDPKFNDIEGQLLFGDHVEIQVTPQTAERANAAGFGFYKIMANVYGLFSDTWYNNGMPGFEHNWSSGCQLKSRFSKNEWWLEIAWPLSSMKKRDVSGPIDRADGLELIMQLVVAGSAVGYGYGGWVPAPWLSFNDFYTVTLDPDAPAFQFTNFGDILHGQLNARVSAQAAPIDATVWVTDADGKELFRKTETAKGRSELAFKASNLPIKFHTEATTFSTDGRNTLGLLVTAGGKTIYRYQGAFAGHSEEFTKRTYQSYLTSRPKGDYTATFAYYPRNGKARVNLDLDVIADLPQHILNAKKLILRIVPKAGGKDVFTTELPINNKTVNQLVTIGPLEGEFTASLELQGNDGKIVSTRKIDFVRKKHDWEGNNIGKERVVLPPFRPIAYNGNTLKTRCAEVTIGDGALFDKLSVMGTDLLRNPVRLTARVGGKTATLQAAPSIERGRGRAFPADFDQYSFMTKNCPRKTLEELPETDGYEALIRSEGALAGLTVTTNATMDYDGQYLVNLTLDPKGAKVNLDSLELTFDLWEQASDLAILRNGSDPAYPLPRKDGIVWESKQYPAKPIGFSGTFIPVLAVSDGFHALQFRAASDQGWLLDDAKSCQVIERRDGKLTLRLLFINTPSTIERPRTITFALMPLPAKPTIANWRYRVWSPDHYFHSAYGWRLYGVGGDTWYLPTDEDYRILGDCLRHPGKYPNRCPAWQGMKEDNTVAINGPILMYSSEPSVGAPLADADSYKGQWFGDSAKTFTTGDPRVGKMRDLTGRFVYDKPECFNELGPLSYDQDLVDNYIWFHKKLVELADTNGTMWDNNSILWYTMLDTDSYGYVRDDGHVQPTNNNFTRRQLLKRLYTMGWLLGKPPFYLFKGIDEEPFSDMGWMIEGPAYIYSEHGTFFDQFTADLTQFRTDWGGGRIPMRIDSAWFTGAMRPVCADKQFRSLFALSVLHDMAVSSMDKPFWDKRLKTLNDAVGFMDPEKQAEFLPYWNNREYIRPGRWVVENNKLTFKDEAPAGVYVSVYRSRTEPKRAVLWFVNATDQDVNVGFWLDAKKLLGKERIDNCTNLDTGEKVLRILPQVQLNDRLLNDKDVLKSLWPSVNVRAKDYRAVIVE